MEQDLKKSLKKCFFIYLALYFALFLLFYIPNYVIEGYADIFGNFEYVRLFLSMLFEFILGSSGAVVLFVVLIKHGPLTPGRTLTAAAVIAAARIIYSLPYYYLYFLSYGYDSIDGIPLYTLSALLAVIFEWVKLLILFALVYFSSRRHIVKALTLSLPKAQQKNMPKKTKLTLLATADARLWGELSHGGIFNFDAPITLGIFLASVGQFVYALSLEVKTAVEYLTEFAGNYRSDEIIYMTWCFIFVILELIISHTVCYFLKNKLTKEPDDAKE